MVKPLSQGRFEGGFRPARSQRAFEEVVAQVEQAILDGRFKPGDRLPAERELTEQFHVSRGTLREAFRVLEYAGLVTITKGTTGGAFVSQQSSLMIANSLKWLLRMRRIQYRDLAEFRERLEGGAARDAAQNASPRHLRRLEEIVAELQQTSRRPELWPRTAELDLDFHRTVVEASGNVLSYIVECSIFDCMRESFGVFSGQQSSRVLHDLSEILRRIEAGDGDGAEAAMRKHIRYFSGLILARDKGGSKASARRTTAGGREQ